MVVDLKDFGGWLKEVMFLKKASVYEVAEKTGVTCDTVYGWIDGEYLPTSKNMQTCINAMGYEIRIEGQVIRTDTFGRWLSSDAKKHGMSDIMLSENLGFDGTYISNLKRTRQIPPETMQYIVERLGKKLEILKIA